MTALVVAAADNGVIGRNNQLPWHLPADLQHFKALTLGHPVVMGRRTYDSIGRALPRRPNLVVTRQPTWAAPGCEALPSLLAALTRAQALDEQVFIIGGGEIFREALPAADTVYLTEVHASPEGDAFFPPLNPGEWCELTRERHEADERHAYAFSFVTLQRR